MIGRQRAIKRIVKLRDLPSGRGIASHRDNDFALINPAEQTTLTGAPVIQFPQTSSNIHPPHPSQPRSASAATGTEPMARDRLVRVFISGPR